MRDAEGSPPSDPHPPISQTGLLPVSPSLEPVLDAARVPQVEPILGPRAIWISALAIGVAFAAGVIARLLVSLIAFFTNLAFRQRISFESVAPAGHHLGLWVVLVPAVGGVIVGLMARYGSRAIRGHGIPEAMEQVLTNQSRIPARRRCSRWVCCRCSAVVRPPTWCRAC